MGSVLISLAAAMLVAHLVTVALYLHRIARPRPLPGAIGQPFVTLLRPVCGRDPHDEETLRSSFQQDYPTYEIIFCAPSPDDPSVALVEQLIAEHPEVPARLLTGETMSLRNPKLRNVFKGWQAAASDWICMTDSNLLLPRDYLATVVASWAPGCGVVSSPPVGARPEGLGGHLECAFLNSNQARLQFAAASLGMAFAQGKTLFYHRPVIEAAGGLMALDRHLAEDVTTTRVVREAGLKVALLPQPYAQPVGRRSLRQALDRQLRWSRLRREGFGWIFALEPFNGVLLPALALIAALMLWDQPLVLLGIYLAFWYGAELVLMQRAGWPASWRDAALLPVRDLLLPVLWVAALIPREVEWRGNKVSTPRTPPAGADTGDGPALQS